MATTKQKQDRLKTVDYSAGSTSLMFPSDLLNDGQDLTCMTFFINTIRNGTAKLTLNGGLSTPKNNLTSAYGEQPVIHEISRGLQRDVGNSTKVFSNTFVRSDQSITLPMPKGLQFSTKSNWSTTEFGKVGMGIDQASDLSKLSLNGSSELAKQIGLNTVGSIASKFANGAIKGKELVELATATVENNYAETMFKNVDNRNFSWTWTLTPRNAKEAVIIDTMLRVLRFHMLPEFKENVGNGNAFLLYPSSFDIVFWSNGAPNKYIPRISTCALTNVVTDYTPTGGYINTINNTPQSYILTLSFAELTTLHKALVGSDTSGTGTTF